MLEWWERNPCADGNRSISTQAPSRPPCGATPFWRGKTLEELTPAEWESLCDGCGLCCLVKLEDEDTGRIHRTDVACTLFDCDACRCRDYANRQARVPDCLKLTPAAVRSTPWLPPTCAYRLVAEGRDLPDWHHLVSGSRNTVHRRGRSALHLVVGTEDEFTIEELMERVLD